MFTFNGLQPWMLEAADYLLLAATNAGAQPRVTSVVRTYGQQVQLYRRYLQGMSPYPAAYPGTSAHELGRAFDVVTNDDRVWLPLMGQLWQLMGGRWGPSDPIHFEA